VFISVSKLFPNKLYSGTQVLCLIDFSLHGIYGIMNDKINQYLLSKKEQVNLNVYWLGLRITAVFLFCFCFYLILIFFFFLPENVLSDVVCWGQYIHLWVKQISCCPRTQTTTVLLYSFCIFFSSYNTTYWGIDIISVEKAMRNIIKQTQEKGVNNWLDQDSNPGPMYH
jgi:hypothetical protein